jgi:CHAD domain-containing protein
MTSTLKSPAARGIRGERFQARAARYRLRCLVEAKALEKAFDPDTVHKLRTCLRRVQSYAEFLEHMEAAKRLGRAVSWFSHLRALYELQRYLRCMPAGPRDMRRVEKALCQEQKRVRKAHYPDRVKQLLATITVDSLMRPDPFIIKRLEQSQLENRTKLYEALQGLPSKPKRKELHALRLLIKSLRYQQEILADVGWGNPETVQALKRLQGVLGKYSDSAQFIRLAKELNLRCRKAIKKDCRQSRARARRAVCKLKSTHMQPILPLRGVTASSNR